MGPGCLHGQRVFHHQLGCFGRAALGLVTSQLARALRCQTDMAHHHNSGFHYGPNLGHNVHPAFQLDGVAFRFFQKTAGIFNRLFKGTLVRHERHIADDKRVGRTAPYRIGVKDHLVHDHRNSAAVSVDAHAQAVAHQQHIQAGRFRELSGRKIIGCQESDLSPFFLHLMKIVDGFLLGHFKSPLF